MPKSYTARLVARVTPDVRDRLCLLALLSRRRVGHVLDDVLDAALPAAETLSAELARRAANSPTHHPPSRPSEHPPPKSGRPPAKRPRSQHAGLPSPRRSARTAPARGCAAPWPPSRYSRPPRQR